MTIWLSDFWGYLPFLYLTVIIHWFYVPSISWIPYFSVCQSGHVFFIGPSVCHTLLLNHWAEFNRYITSPHGKDVREQHFFLFFRHPSLCPARYLLLNLWAEFNQTCYIMVKVCEGNIIFQSVCHAILLNHQAEFNQTCSMIFP